MRRFIVSRIVSASILSADLCNLESEIKRAEDAGCEYIHFDVMDGVFVNNISYGIPVLKSVSKVTKAVLDVHLMITDPIRYIKQFAKAGADIITFHLEAAEDPDKVIDEIHACGKKAGIAIKPDTPVKDVIPYLDKVEMVLVMTVEPGFGGQGFIRETLDKIRELKQTEEKRGLSVPIQVDGGINAATAVEVSEAGAEILVAGSYLFGADNMADAAALLRK
jgi:ribulose-phosphate 3-epimerase